MSVSFHTLTTTALKNRRALKAFIPTIFNKESTALQSISIIFCTDEYLLTINQQSLQHDFYTDIITFDLSETQTSPKIAELYISVDRVKDNSANLHIPFQTELHRVIFHGCLHLCGYKDKSSKHISIMRAKEEKYLNEYFNCS